MKLARRLPGRIGSARIYLVDASVEGIRIAHQSAVPAVGQVCRVSFEWEGQPIELDCEVIHNSLVKLAKTANEKSIYQAGLRVANALGNSRDALRQLVSDCVARALDEQKANARGVPAESAQMFQTGGGTNYVRCEFVDGVWRRTETSRPDQPVNGFTVSVAEGHEQIEILCQTFAISDANGRNMIRTMAAMSISQSEGLPTRKYNP